MLWVTVGLLVFGIAAVHFAITAYLQRPGAEQRQGKGRRSFLVLAIAAVAAGVALFSGGCTLIFLGELARGPQHYIDAPAVLTIGGVPFAVSALIWWLSMRRKS